MYSIVQVAPTASSVDRELLALVGTNRPRFGFIPSQADRDRRYFSDRRQYYAQYGIDLAVAAGGVLVNVSAGAILMTPDTSTALICPDEPVDGLSDLRGLGLVDFAFVPHWGSIQADVSDLVAYSKEHGGMRVYGCPDGSGIVVKGSDVSIVGDVVTVVDGVREFGVAVAGARYVLRPGGYAVIFRANNEVAVSATPRGYHLPGGGQDANESLEETTIREVREECGLDIRIDAHIGTADELVYSARELTYFRKRCTFFLASVLRCGSGCEPDHRLEWVPLDCAASQLVHESHRWAVTEARRLMDEIGEKSSTPNRHM